MNHTPKVLVHLHLYYHDQLDFMISKLKNIVDCDWDLYVTVCEENIDTTKKLLQLKPDVKIITVENLGYDIWPFIQVLRMINLDDYDYVLKIHTKNFYNDKIIMSGYKYSGSSICKGYFWRNQLLKPLIWSKKRFKQNLALLAKDTKIGIITDESFLVPLQKHREEDTTLLQQIKARLQINSTYSLFIAGTMFIIRSEILKKLANSNIQNIDFSQESATGSVGTIAYAIERVFTLLTDGFGYKVYGIIDWQLVIKTFFCNLLKNIFSIYNEKEHKIIKIFGFKLKVKRHTIKQIFSIDDDIIKIPFALGGRGIIGKTIYFIGIEFHTYKFNEYLSLLIDKLKNKYKNELALVAIIKNEAPYIIEWIEYHKLVGINKFYIYDNDSTDNIKKVLKPYIKKGEVVYKYFPGNGMQCKAYQDAIDKYKYQNKYLGFIDIDEFLFPIKNQKISTIIEEILSKDKKAAGVAVQWCVFGSSGYIEKPKGLVTENYTMRANGHFESKSHNNRHIKTLCNPRKVLIYGQCHYPKYFKDFHSVNTNIEQIDGPFNESLCWDTLRINHYFTKSFEEYKAKRERGRASTMGLKWDINDFYEADVNEVNDTTIHRYLEELKVHLNNN